MADLKGADGGLRELALFAGAGGGILGGKLLGWRTVCAVERDAYAAQVLAQRQNDGMLEAFPIWSDVCSFDGRPWRGIVDIISGGFPCQDISPAGKGAGIDGAASGLWSQFARIIGEVGPEWVFIENSPLLTGRGLDRVLQDLCSMRFDAEWEVIEAASVGAPHRRARIWILAHAQRFRPHPAENVCVMEGQGPGELRPIEPRNYRSEWWDAEPGMDRMAHELAHRVDRLKAIGNGQVPAVAALAFSTLYNRLTEN